MRKNSFKRIFAALALTAVATSSVASISAFAAEGDGPTADGTFIFEGVEYDPAGATTTPTLSMTKKTYTESEAKALAEAGTPIEISLTVSGASAAYASTGIHMFYDDRLGVTLDPFGSVNVKFGEAVSYLTPMSEENKTGVPGVFVTTGGSADKGLDGVFYTMNVTLPTDVKAGDVYAFDLAYVEGDLFTNKADDEAGRLMQAYTFVNGLDDGYIEIVADPTEPPTEPVTTTTTTAATTTTTTTTAKATTTTTTAKATTTTTAAKTDSPKTGVAGVGVAAAGLVVAAGAAFVLRKKED